ncbi:MAG: hypothetical protein ACPIOQ_58030, partial [Promethearchaeia archaeon]
NVKPTGHFTTYKHSYEITAQLPSQTQTSPQQKFRPKLLPYSPTAICNRSTLSMETNYTLLFS